ncbi:hypothetical protein EU527_16420 [Candidatus Thorarchaeota archaeon]|nr:MAG: hypothetical protein EU527_16420 [Candidatus Thorarchaeota archaeon]
MHHLLDINLAKEQHSSYCETLEQLGLDLIQLDSDEDHPDSCFVEDTAIVFGDKAVITRMAKESRRGEVDSISSVLSDCKNIKKIEDPGTIEGGDVIHLDNSLISGITQRTNREGIAQTSKWLSIKIDVIEDLEIVHLKSHVTYLGRNTILVSDRFYNHPLFSEFIQIHIPYDEAYAANTLTIDDVVLISSRHPKTICLVKEAGFEVIPLNMSEFEKCEGALTCLSIIF